MGKESSSSVEYVVVGLAWGLVMYSLTIVLNHVRVACVSKLPFMVFSWGALLVACFLSGRAILKKKVAEERESLLISYGWLLEKCIATEGSLKELEEEKQELLADRDASYQINGGETDRENANASVRSDTVRRLNRAIDAFPAQYPEYLVKPPKLDSDVRPWLKGAGIAINDREAHVFGAIISEHFKLQPDSQKPH